MKKILLLLIVLMGSCFAQGSRESDSLALMALQNANPDVGLGWEDGKPMDRWYSVELVDGRVTSLIFFNIQINIIPPEFCNLTKLELLTFDYPQFATLPPEFGDLTSLRRLTFWQGTLKELPREFGNLTNLDSLHFTGCKLTTLPEEIVNLGTLSDFGAKDNYLTKESLSASVIEWLNNNNTGWEADQKKVSNQTVKQKLLSIKRENPEANLSWDIYDTITSWEGVTFDQELKDVTGLDLKNRNLSVIPAKMCQLENLLHLDLGNNNLTTLPGGIIDLGEEYHDYGFKLKSFDVSLNILIEENISSSIIYWLDQNDRDWKSTQKEIADLRVKFNLLHINDSNPELQTNWDIFTDVKTWEGVTYDDYLKDIIEINLPGKNITTVPDSIITLSRLTVLDLSNNRIDSLPKSMGEFKYLRNINLSNNRLVILPEEILTLTPTNGLDVSNNGLKEIYMTNEMIAWLDTYDPDWRDTQGEVAIETAPVVKQKSLSVNASGSKLSFSTPLKRDTKLSIFTLNGKKVMQSSVSGESVNLPSLSKGIYVVKIANGSLNKVFKISIK